MAGKRLYTLILCVVFVLTVALSGTSASTPESLPYPRVTSDKTPCNGVVPGEVLVTTAPGTSLSSLGMDVQRHIESLDVAVVRVPVGQERLEAARLSKQPGVQLAQPNYVYAAQRVPNDEYYADYQRNYPQIGLPSAWDITTGSADVVVAVLDTGTDLGHPELAGQLVAGYDFINSDADPSDDNGHGTHVTGIVAALSNNAVGVAGVAWQTKAMPVKVLAANGQGSTAAIAEGIRWAVDNGADIINMSLSGTGDPGGDLISKAAIDYAYGRGALLIASMGNLYQEGNPVQYPAAHDHVVAVGSVSDTDQHARYSCTGPHNDLMAPGGDPDSQNDQNMDHWIMSTGLRSKAGLYAWYDGTSQAAPHVAGVAALIMAAAPSLSADQVEQLLKETAVDLGSAGFDNTFGYGRVDAAAALAQVAGQATATPSHTAQPPSATPTQTLPPETATPTQTSAPATATATRQTTPAPQTEFVVLPVLMRQYSAPRPATPTATMTPQLGTSATPTETTAPITHTPTATTEPMGELPVAGIWEGDWIVFEVSADRQHIIYAWYLGDCAELEMYDDSVPIASDGSWTVLFGNETLGGGIVGQFSSSTACSGQTESWDLTDQQNPCHAIEDWTATPE